jgi:hypothetical protein
MQVIIHLEHGKYNSGVVTNPQRNGVAPIPPLLGCRTKMEMWFGYRTTIEFWLGWMPDATLTIDDTAPLAGTEGNYYVSFPCFQECQ